MSDLIEKQVAIDALGEQYPYHDGMIADGMRAQWRKDFNSINELPPAEQRTARWLINSDGYYPYCSNCKTEPKSGELTPYCPYCGARMIEEDANERS